MLRPLITIAVLVLSTSVATPAQAAPAASGKDKKGAGAKKKAAAAPDEASLEALRKQLSGDEESVLAALKALAESEDPAAPVALGELLLRGGTPKVLEEALKTAGKLKAPELTSAVAPYVQHRTDDVRRAAVRALLKTKGPLAIETLRKALRSGDAVVRGTAATGLGELGSHESLPDLFNAFDRGVAEAGASIGQLCTPEECEKYAERTGRIGLDVMVTGFDQILFRPAASISDEQKLRLVGRLRELGTPEAGKYLADVSERWPKEWSTKVKQALDAAARSVAGGKK